MQRTPRAKLHARIESKFELAVNIQCKGQKCEFLAYFILLPVTFSLYYTKNFKVSASYCLKGFINLSICRKQHFSNRHRVKNKSIKLAMITKQCRRLLRIEMYSQPKNLKNA
jgi:hypothetical protein